MPGRRRHLRSQHMRHLAPRSRRFPILVPLRRPRRTPVSTPSWPAPRRGAARVAVVPGRTRRFVRESGEHGATYRSGTRERSPARYEPARDPSLLTNAEAAFRVRREVARVLARRLSFRSAISSATEAATSRARGEARAKHPRHDPLRPVALGPSRPGTRAASSPAPLLQGRTSFVHMQGYFVIPGWGLSPPGPDRR